MTWEIAASIAEIVSAIAVVISLLYLANEVRQNTVASRASTHQQYIDTQTNVNRATSDDPEVASLIARANADYDSLSDEEIIRLQFVFYNHFNQWHLAFTTQRKALLDDEMLTVVNRGYMGYLQSSVAFQRMWEACGYAYDDAFQSHVTKIIADAEIHHQFPGFSRESPTENSVGSET